MSVLSTFVGKQTDYVYVAINIKPLRIADFTWRHINKLISFHDLKIPFFLAVALCL